MCASLPTHDAVAGAAGRVGLALPGLAVASPPPVVSTISPSSISGTGATLNATVNAEDQSGTDYQFLVDYSRDQFCTSGGASGNAAGHYPATPASLGSSDNADDAVSMTIAGFEPGESICYAVEATNSGNPTPVVGLRQTFTTTPEVITTGSATSVVNGGAMFNGIINAQGQPDTSYYFRYAASTSSPSSCRDGQTAMTSLASTDSSEHAVSATVANLTPSTTYCVELVSVRLATQRDHSNIATFTTPPPSTLAVTVTGGGMGRSALPTPVRRTRSNADLIAFTDCSASVSRARRSR